MLFIDTHGYHHGAPAHAGNNIGDTDHHTLQNTLDHFEFSLYISYFL